MDRGSSCPLGSDGAVWKSVATPSWTPGAEYCVFAREHAENLGLDIESGHPLRLSTLTGNTVAYGHEVTLLAMEHELTGICYFFENPAIRRSFLGRNGWLNRLRVGIDDTGPSGVLYAGLLPIDTT